MRQQPKHATQHQQLTNSSNKIFPLSFPLPNPSTSRNISRSLQQHPPPHHQSQFPFLHHHHRFTSTSIAPLPQQYPLVSPSLLLSVFTPNVHWTSVPSLHPPSQVLRLPSYHPFAALSPPSPTRLTHHYPSTPQQFSAQYTLNTPVPLFVAHMYHPQHQHPILINNKTAVACTALQTTSLYSMTSHPKQMAKLNASTSLLLHPLTYQQTLHLFKNKRIKHNPYHVHHRTSHQTHLLSSPCPMIASSAASVS